MPIFRINDQLHYFAQVPKCGGTAVEAYLTGRFGPLAFDEHTRQMPPRHQRWAVESINHIPVAELDRIFPRSWFASSFATVRHPLPRLISAFFFARDFMKLMPLSSEFNSWFRQALDDMGTQPWKYGSHLLPQTLLVPADANVFRLEDGLDTVIPHLDKLAGNNDGPRSIAPRNVGRWRSEEAAPVPSQDTLDLLARTYAADFERFGYEPPLSVAAAAALPDLPVLAATGAAPAPRPRSFVQKLQRSLMKRAGM